MYLNTAISICISLLAISLILIGNTSIPVAAFIAITAPRKPSGHTSERNVHPMTSAFGVRRRAVDDVCAFSPSAQVIRNHPHIPSGGPWNTRRNQMKSNLAEPHVVKTQWPQRWNSWYLNGCWGGQHNMYICCGAHAVNVMYRELCAGIWILLWVLRLEPE